MEALGRGNSFPYAHMPLSQIQFCMCVLAHHVHGPVLNGLQPGTGPQTGELGTPGLVHIWITFPPNPIKLS